MTDNSLQSAKIPVGVKYEVILSVVACKDIAAGHKPIRFDVSVGAPGA